MFVSILHVPSPTLPDPTSPPSPPLDPARPCQRPSARPQPSLLRPQAPASVVLQRECCVLPTTSASHTVTWHLHVLRTLRDSLPKTNTLSFSPQPLPMFPTLGVPRVVIRRHGPTAAPCLLRLRHNLKWHLHVLFAVRQAAKQSSLFPETPLNFPQNLISLRIPPLVAFPSHDWRALLW